MESGAFEYKPMLVTSPKVRKARKTVLIQRTIESLEKVLVQKQQGIFENLIQFAEFHPTKLRLVVYTSAGAAKSSSRTFSNFRGIGSSHTIKVGGESHKVGELSTVVIFELEAYPEPKILTSDELKPLMRVWGSTVAVAKFLGCSQSHVSERLNSKNKKRGK